MKVLCLWRPWLAIILAGKPVENRGWRTGYRGLLLLHAGQRWDPDALALAAEYGIVIPTSPDAHSTGIVVLARLTGICSAEAFDAGPCIPAALCTCGPWAFAGQHHWQLVDIRPIDPPIGYRGHQGIRWAPDNVQLAVLPYLREEPGTRVPSLTHVPKPPVPARRTPEPGRGPVASIGDNP